MHLNKGFSITKDKGEDGNPYGNMRVVVYDIFEIPWVVVKKKKIYKVGGCIGSD